MAREAIEFHFAYKEMRVRSAAGLGIAQLRFVAVNKLNNLWCWVNSIASGSLSRFPMWYVMEESGQKDNLGSTMKKMLAKLFAVKWHLCNWSHSDWGIVLNNLGKCWACVSCPLWTSITTAFGKLVGGLCPFASAMTVLVRECSVKSTLQVHNQDTDKHSSLPTQQVFQCFGAEAEQAGKYRCKT